LKYGKNAILYPAMKMTMHINDGLLKRVMEATGVESKTRAIDLALREFDRRAELKRLTAEGLGVTADELKDAFDPGYNLEEARRTETPVSYVRKPRSR
jgi:Arc/MetJ family transcription regulator